MSKSCDLSGQQVADRPTRLTRLQAALKPKRHLVFQRAAEQDHRMARVIEFLKSLNPLRLVRTYRTGNRAAMKAVRYRQAGDVESLLLLSKQSDDLDELFQEIVLANTIYAAFHGHDEFWFAEGERLLHKFRDRH